MDKKGQAIPLKGFFERVRFGLFCHCALFYIRVLAVCTSFYDRSIKVNSIYDPALFRMVKTSAHVDREVISAIQKRSKKSVGTVFPRQANSSMERVSPVITDAVLGSGADMPPLFFSRANLLVRLFLDFTYASITASPFSRIFRPLAEILAGRGGHKKFARWREQKKMGAFHTPGLYYLFLLVQGFVHVSSLGTKKMGGRGLSSAARAAKKHLKKMDGYDLTVLVYISYLLARNAGTIEDTVYSSYIGDIVRTVAGKITSGAQKGEGEVSSRELEKMYIDMCAGIAGELFCARKGNDPKELLANLERVKSVVESTPESVIFSIPSQLLFLTCGFTADPRETLSTVGNDYKPGDVVYNPRTGSWWVSPCSSSTQEFIYKEVERSWAIARWGCLFQSATWHWLKKKTRMPWFASFDNPLNSRRLRTFFREDESAKSRAKAFFSAPYDLADFPSVEQIDFFQPNIEEACRLVAQHG